MCCLVVGFHAFHYRCSHSTDLPQCSRFRKAVWSILEKGWWGMYLYVNSDFACHGKAFSPFNSRVVRMVGRVTTWCTSELVKVCFRLCFGIFIQLLESKLAGTPAEKAFIRRLKSGGEEEQSASQQQRRKRKGPNPLSCLKKKKKPSTEPQQAAPAEEKLKKKVSLCEIANGIELLTGSFFEFLSCAVDWADGSL